MQELLDQPIDVPSNSYLIPTRAKWVGFLLLFIWGALLFLDISVFYLSPFIMTVVYVILLFLYMLLFGKPILYQQISLQERAKKYALGLLFPLLGLLLPYFLWYVEWVEALANLCVLFLIGGCTHFVLTLFEKAPKAAVIWPWLKTMVIAWIVVFCARLYNLEIATDTELFIYEWSYPGLFLFGVIYSFQQYQKWSKETMKKLDNGLLLLFIICAHLVIVGRLSYMFFSGYGLPIIVLGIGGMLLIALIAWVKDEKPTYKAQSQ